MTHLDNKQRAEKQITTQKQNILYALHYKGKLLGTFKWSQFGPSGLSGWRPPKKIYFKLGIARSGATYLPVEILDNIEIVEYTPNQVIEKLNTKKQKIKKIESDIKKYKKILKYHAGGRSFLEHNQRMQAAEEKIKSLTESLKDIN